MKLLKLPVIGGFKVRVKTLLLLKDWWYYCQNTYPWEKNILIYSVAYHHQRRQNLKILTLTYLFWLKGLEVWVPGEICDVWISNINILICPSGIMETEIRETPWRGSFFNLHNLLHYYNYPFQSYFLYILQSLLVCLADMLSLSTKEKLYIRDIHIGYDISLPELSEMTISSNSIFNYWKVIQRYLESNPTAKIKIRLK